MRASLPKLICFFSLLFSFQYIFVGGIFASDGDPQHKYQQKKAYNQNDSVETDPAISKALKLIEGFQGKATIQLVQAHYKLAELYLEKNPDKAEEQFKEVLTLFETNPILDRQEFIGAHRLLAAFYMNQNKLETAKLISSKGLKIKKQIENSDPSAKFTGPLEQAYNLDKSGLSLMAELIYLQEIKMTEQDKGMSSPELLPHLEELLNLYYMYRWGQPCTDALVKRIKQIQASIVLKGSDQRVRMLTESADLLLEQPDFKVSEVEKLYKEALTLQEQGVGMGHKDAMWSLKKVADFYRTIGQSYRVEPLYLDALSRAKLLKGSGDASLLPYLKELGISHQYASSYENWEKYFLEAVQVSKDYYGSQSIQAAGSLSDLGCYYQKGGEKKSKEPWFGDSESTTSLKLALKAFQ